MQTKPLYVHIAELTAAMENCRKTDNAEWLEKHQDTIDELVKNHMPRGSGIDCGCEYDNASTPNRLCFTTSYHHMDEYGGYDGWTDHTVIVTPDLSDGFNLRITGRNRNDIKDYLHEVFDLALRQEITR